MNVHILQHVPFEGIGSMEPWLLRRSANISSTRFFESWELPDVNNLDLIIAMGGLNMLLLVWMPSMVFAASIGVWLFYVQHQFEETHWSKTEDWQLHHAALEGSSHYVLPQPLRWLTANIGIHHVHHLYSRIPFYRLPEVLKDNADLAEAQRLTIWQSFKSVNLHLWDEKLQKLMSFREAKRLYGVA